MISQQIAPHLTQRIPMVTCNPHTFRRTFASNLHRRGLDIEHIMRLGGWESLDMVLRYTRSVRFEESLKLYREIEK
ncbi:tyrosine-type recombinase/integrase [Chloroflexota bacterium]